MLRVWLLFGLCLLSSTDTAYSYGGFGGLLKSALDWFWSYEVCYDSLGCFSTNYPYTNTERLPRNPSEFETQYILYTRENYQTASQAYVPEKLRLSDNVMTSPWKRFRKSSAGVKIIIHGYQDTYRENWIKNMTKALLQHDDYNIILVDYETAAFEAFYSQSVANARVVGAHLAEFILFLTTLHGVDIKDVHLIGHSLGAHVAGYAGERLDGLGRITGLDPAGPAFENYDPRVRLDPTDAQFVDVIHTDAESLLHFGFGLQQAIGTADFYPNGGKDQPGCPVSRLEHFTKPGATFGCSHFRAPELFTASINQTCTFQGFPCDVINAISRLNCTSCGSGSCPNMGFHTKNDTNPGKYYLQTSDKAPFC